MEVTQETTEQKAAAEAKAAETKATGEKAAAEKTAAEEKVATEQDAAAEKLGADFDKKVDEGDEHTAYTETDEEKKAKAEEAEAKAKADAEASKKDPDKEVDESLLARAEQAGMSREKAGEFSSKEDLERAVEVLEESQSKATSPEELEAEKKAKEEAEAKVKDDEAPYECGLNPSEYDEGLIKVVNDLGTMLKKRVVALEASHSEHAKVLTSDRVTKHTDWLDSKINRLSDDDLKKIYGEGDIDDLEENSEQFKARAALDTKIAKVAADLRKAKKTVPSRNKLFDMAIEALHESKKQQKVDAKTTDKLKKRAEEALGPGSSGVSAESTEAEALQLNKDFDSKLDKES